MIELSLDQWEIEAGSTLIVRARRKSDAGKPWGALQVKIGWRTEGRGNVDRKTVYQTRQDLASDECAIALPIPLEGPLSFDGKLIRIIWEVAARPADREGPAPVVSAAFRVVPRGVHR